MAGRHLKVEVLNSFASRNGVKGLATAAIAGTFVGFASPIAFAAPETAKAEANVPEKAVAATVSLETEQSVFEAPAVEIETGVQASSGWDFSQVEVEAKAAETAAAPAARTENRRRSDVAANTAAAPKKQVAAYSNVPASGRGAAVVAFARQFAGTRYVYGGTTPAGWDCSGFVGYVYANAGVALPRTSSGQAAAGVRVPASQAQPGDIVWWPGHVGIYTGNGMHIAAQTTSAGTRETPLYGKPTFIRVP